jgi:single-strand DNA-binding protein
MATNRQWTTDAGEKREEAEFHRIVAWNKLAELCSQLLFKGRRVFVEGRLQTRQWTAQDGTPRQTTETVISDMIILDSKRAPGEVGEPIPEEPEVMKEAPPKETTPKAKTGKQKAAKEKKPSGGGKAAGKPAAKTDAKKSAKASSKTKKKDEEEVKADDIPF